MLLIYRLLRIFNLWGYNNINTTVGKPIKRFLKCTIGAYNFAL